jgi:hypothetical protein
MEHDDTPKSQPRSPRAEPPPAPTEGEMSRIAREAVRQPADPRLDNELARMGLADTAASPERQPGQPRGRSVVTSAEFERLRTELRRVEVILWALVGVTGILAVIVVVLLIR